MKIGNGPIKDEIYITTALTAPAQVEVFSGRSARASMSRLASIMWKFPSKQVGNTSPSGETENKSPAAKEPR